MIMRMCVCVCVCVCVCLNFYESLSKVNLSSDMIKKWLKNDCKIIFARTLQYFSIVCSQLSDSWNNKRMTNSVRVTQKYNSQYTHKFLTFGQNTFHCKTLYSVEFSRAINYFSNLFHYHLIGSYRRSKYVKIFTNVTI